MLATVQKDRGWGGEMTYKGKKGSLLYHKCLLSEHISYL